MSNYTYIDCRISGSDLICDRRKIVSGNAVKIRAVFDEGWSGLNRYFAYRSVIGDSTETGESYYKDEPIDISGIFNGDGFLEFGFIGRDDDGNVIKSTNICTIIVEKGAYIVNPGVRADALSIIGRFCAVERSVLVANNTADDAKTVAGEAKTSAENAVTVSGKAKTIAGEAKNIAKDAMTSAENAVNVSNDAKGIADEAKTKASGAKTSAENAVKTADDAKTIAGEAKTKASEAKTSAENAVTISNDSKSIADEAKNIASGAKTSAENAVKTADDAKTIAGEAKTKASDAKATADEVKARADRGEFDGKSFTYEDLTEENKMDLLGNVSNAFKGQASGELIQLTDISPIVHGIKVKCSPGVKVTRCGENLLPYPYYRSTTTNSGITWTDNGDGSLTVNGTAIGNNAAVFYLAFGTLNLKDGVTYYVSDLSSKDLIVYIMYKDESGTIKNTAKPLTWSKAYTFERIYISVSTSGSSFTDEVIYPYLSVREDAEYEPYKSEVFTADANGNAIIPSVYPTTTIFADADGAMIEAEYNKDLNKVFGNIDEALDAILAIQEQYLPQEAIIEDAPEAEGGDVE